jgi:6-phosphogluconolactonase
MADADAVVAAATETIAVALHGRAAGHPLHLALTGGRVGTRVSQRLAALGAASEAHCWWGDERWVPRSSPDRNDAVAAELAAGGFAVHRAPSPESGLDVAVGAAVWGDAIRTALPAGPDGRPVFDLVVLGVGEDGHVASLFPGRDDLLAADGVAVAVRDSPKPPPERLSLTLPVLCAAREVLLVVAGAGKRDAVQAVRRSWESEVPPSVPAALVRGTECTVLIADAAAAG